MTKILLNGCNGAMGRAISEHCKKRDDVDIVAGIDVVADMNYHYPVYDRIEDFKGECDVVIDFSNPQALTSVVSFAVKNAIPAVIATTGLSDEQHKFVVDSAEKTAIFSSANMSLGINLLSSLVKKAASVLGLEYNIEIVEAHHNQKLDSPSGTALMLATAAQSAFDEDMPLEFDRHSKREKRSKNEIGIHSIRGGTIVGEHDVIFAGDDEIITLSHSARSKSVFAAGAVNAAIFLKDKKAGMYCMDDLISEKI